MTTQTPHLTVYSKPQCVQCDATYRTLDRAQVAYTAIDIDADEQARQYALSLGYLSAPVVVWTDSAGRTHHWSGFNPDQLKSAIADLPERRRTA